MSENERDTGEEVLEPGEATDEAAEVEGTKGPKGKWTRRAFIGAGTLAGGGLVLGVGGVVFAPNRLRIGPEPEGGVASSRRGSRLPPPTTSSSLSRIARWGRGRSRASP